MIHSASPQSRLDTLCENNDHYRPGLWSASRIKIKKLNNMNQVQYLVN